MNKLLERKYFIYVVKTSKNIFKPLLPLCVKL